MQPSFDSSQKTPDIIGLNSSFPVAKSVLLIADDKTSEGMFVLDAECIDGVFGNSSPFCPASLNLPFSEPISIPFVFLSIKNVSG